MVRKTGRLKVLAEVNSKLPIVNVVPKIKDAILKLVTMEVHHPTVDPDIHREKNFKEYFLEFVMIFLDVTMGLTDFSRKKTKSLKSTN